MAGYIALVHKDEGTSFGVSFPDVPGCISAGDTLDEALAKAAEALGGHLALMREDGDAEPKIRGLEAIKDDPEWADDFADALVRVVSPAEPIEQVSSSAIRGYSYDEKRRELRVRYTGGGEYVYLDVPPREFEALKAAESKGRHINTEIKPKYPYRDLPSSWRTVA